MAPTIPRNRVRTSLVRCTTPATPTTLVLPVQEVIHRSRDSQTFTNLVITSIITVATLPAAIVSAFCTTGVPKSVNPKIFFYNQTATKPMVHWSRVSKSSPPLLLLPATTTEAMVSANQFFNLNKKIPNYLSPHRRPPRTWSVKLQDRLRLESRDVVFRKHKKTL